MDLDSEEEFDPTWGELASSALIKSSAVTRNAFCWDYWWNSGHMTSHERDCLGIVRGPVFSVAMGRIRAAHEKYKNVDPGGGAQRRDVRIRSDLEGIEVTPSECLLDRMILYFHGGAHLMGSVDTHAKWIGSLAEVTSARVVAINYRLAPDFPFPCALEDCLDTLRWMRKEYSSASIALAGDSAGGNLAFALLLKLHEVGEPQPLACLGFSPWLLLDPTRVAELRGDQFAGDKMYLGSDLTRAYREMTKIPFHKTIGRFCSGTFHDIGVTAYVQIHPPSDPLVSPLLASEAVVRHFPPVLIHADRDEPLKADAEAMVALCRRADVTAELELYSGVGHAFQVYNTGQATRSFEPGEMGIDYDDNGFVESVRADGQAHTKGMDIKCGHRIVKVRPHEEQDAESYSNLAVRRAEQSGRPYKVTFQVCFQRNDSLSKVATFLEKLWKT